MLRTAISEKWEIIVTSHDKRYEFKGSRRYEPVANEYEIDRFTDELIEKDTCFLYGDTYYTEHAIETIVKTDTDRILFFGNERSIVAVTIADQAEFRHHKDLVKKKYIAGEIGQCKGWQVYQSFTGQDLSAKPEIKENFVVLDDGTADVNTPEDYRRLV